MFRLLDGLSAEDNISEEGQDGDAFEDPSKHQRTSSPYRTLRS
jgi:hypothetical protein